MCLSVLVVSHTFPVLTSNNCEGRRDGGFSVIGSTTDVDNAGQSSSGCSPRVHANEPTVECDSASCLHKLKQATNLRRPHTGEFHINIHERMFAV